MRYKSISNRAFSLWSLATALEGLLAAYFVAREPSEAGSVLAFGLSPQRLLIVGSSLVLALFFVFVALTHFYRLNSWNEIVNKRPQAVRYVLAGLLFLEIVVLHLLFLIPENQFPTLYGYLFRLRPALIWFALIFAQTFIFLAWFGYLSLNDLKGRNAYKPLV